MENSIEEDITLIEKSLCDKDTIIQYHYWVGTDFLNAVERIVADYKRVLKENEELRADNYELNNRITDLLENIPVQKVKDKIEEYDKQRIKMEKNDIGVGFTLGKEWSDLKAKIKVLQELLGSEE